MMFNNFISTLIPLYAKVSGHCFIDGCKKKSLTKKYGYCNDKPLSTAIKESKHANYPQNGKY